MPEPPSLSVRARHTYGSLTLDVDFTITRWPAVLFGPSGAGKSSLLRLIAGLDQGRPCHIQVNQHSVARTREGSPVQLVSQRPALFPHLTVEGNIAFGLRKLSRQQQQARVEEMLTLLGAEALSRRMPHQLSGGERQRVAIARSLAPRPTLLLLDEAFTGLDSRAKEEILGRLAATCRDQGIASLHVTHEVADAFALAAEVLVLEQGRLVAQGSCAEALARERAKLLEVLQSTNSLQTAVRT